jgi:regulator of sirC expression with transglutaminase-like and TPR domain
MGLPLLQQAIAHDDVEHAATAIAIDLHPHLRAEHVASQLDALAAQLSPSVSTVRGHARLGRLLRGFYGELRFTTPESYEDPRANLVNEVIERRQGSPVALAALAVAVGKRLDVELHGVAFPGHFMLRYEASQPIFVDPASGAFPFPAECLRKLASEELRIHEDDADRFLLPVTARTFAVRLLQNLQRSYEDRGDLGRALLIADRLFDVTGSASARCDRGLKAAILGAPHAALDDLTSYLRDHEDEAVATAASRLKPSLLDLN